MIVAGQQDLSEGVSAGLNGAQPWHAVSVEKATALVSEAVPLGDRISVAISA